MLAQAEEQAVLSVAEAVAVAGLATAQAAHRRQAALEAAPSSAPAARGGRSRTSRAAPRPWGAVSRPVSTTLSRRTPCQYSGIRIMPPNRAAPRQNRAIDAEEKVGRR
jgi:hypothetical protein